jgi:hypothetical protein
MKRKKIILPNHRRKMINKMHKNKIYIRDKNYKELVVFKYY